MFAHASWSSFNEPEAADFVVRKGNRSCYAMLFGWSPKFQSVVVLLSMEERSASFATSISSRVDDTAVDNLERSNWLASVPVLSTYTQRFNTCWLPTVQFNKRQIQDSPRQFLFRYLTIESTDSTFPFPRLKRASSAFFHCWAPMVVFTLLQQISKWTSNFETLTFWSKEPPSHDDAILTILRALQPSKTFHCQLQWYPQCNSSLSPPCKSPTFPARTR